MSEQFHEDEVPEHGHQVTITVNGHEKQIHRGRQTVAHIKEVGGVPAAEELEQVVNGVFNPLPDDGAVTIKGGELFISHVRASSSS